MHLQRFFREARWCELQEKEGIRILWNGPQPGERRLSGNVSVSFPDFDQRTLLINLDLAGICASGGSACTSGALEPSHVLMAMTQDRKRAEGTLRFTLGVENTEEEILQTVRVLRETVDRISHDREHRVKCHN